jgi:hypothetical protein
MPISYAELKEIISDKLLKMMDSKDAINEALREMDGLPNVLPVADAFVPLNPIRWGSYTAGLIAGSDAPTLGDKVYAPLEHLSNLNLAVSSITSDQLYCLVIREMIEELAKVNAMSELGGDPGAFLAGANAYQFSVRILNEVGMAEANRRQNEILPGVINRGFVRELGIGRANVPKDLRLNPWDIKGKARDAINKTYFNPPTIGKGILEARRSGKFNNNAFRSISKFNNFNGGAYVLIFECGKGYLFRKSVYEIAKISSTSPYVRIAVFAASSYSCYALFNFYLSLCKFSYQYSFNEEYRFSFNSKVVIAKDFISENALKTYDFLLVNLYLCSHQENLERIHL